ncbi:MAG TPA: DUF4864 domain-containing protein [Ramlibacter sp.]|nr:DUF4864 domain-containing protein [Ramlibacter sp.]
MRVLFTRIVSTMVLACAAAAVVPLGAAPVAESEVQKIQAVIVAQLSAFADDDADRAFQTATPAVREAIGASGLFLALVRGAYPMIYRPASVTFHKPEQDAGSVLQLVEITDSEEKSWFALFALELQPDASWRISGCLVRENHWRPV